ncbi:MAG TPA: hypothetical protein VK307_05540 [Thermoleophilaceae bacterium]|nr:hypothetical protein [Thermoleophilaceae bacterium]
MTTSFEPILGWRVWHVEPGADGARLLSWSQSAEWPVARRMDAGCRAPLGLGWRRPAHGAPRAGHRCGIYAFRERADAERLLLEAGPAGAGRGRLAAALGRVSLWGRVFENTRGWRAEFAYPYDLLLFGGDQRLAAELRAGYAVDVMLADA